MIKIKKTKFNIFILGDSQVGKTSMIQVYRGNKLNSEELPTIGLDICMNPLAFEDIEYKFKLFDLSGQEKYKDIFQSKFRLADGIMLVFSINDLDSLKNIDNYIKILDEVVKYKKLKIILVGNKVDLGRRVISNEEAVNFSKKRNLSYYETSAKTGYRIKETFNNFFRELYELNKLKEAKNDS